MDNLDKLLDTVEHPERYSENELTQLLSDPEFERMYRLLCAARMQPFTKAQETESDVDEQWNRFRQKRRKPAIFSWLYNRKTAVAVGLVIVSFSVIAVGVSFSTGHNRINMEPDNTPLFVEPQSSQNQESSIPRNDMSADTIIIFENETLDKVLSEVAPYYGAEVNLKSPRSGEIRLFLRWDSSTPIEELIDHLNTFDRINLTITDNTITDF